MLVLKKYYAAPMDVSMIKPFNQVEDEVDRIMDATKATTAITAKGQVTLPKRIREAVGLKPGDKVDVRATASGGVYIEKPGTSQRYRERLYAIAKERPIRDMTTDEFMKIMRGDPAEDPPLAETGEKP
jgi:antitoxin PrlF